MPEFDPYRKWLGIKPEEQPPHHYRLLGVSLYEDDPDVIDAAVEQRVAFLQTCASGPNLKHSQTILNEVAEARNVLLDPTRKVAYDAELKTKLESVPRKLSASDAVGRGGAGDDWEITADNVAENPAGWKNRRKQIAQDAESTSKISSQPETVEPGGNRKQPPEADSKPVASVAARLRKRRSRSKGMIVAAVLAVAAMGGLVWWLVKGDGTEVIDELAKTGAAGENLTDGGSNGTSTGNETSSPGDGRTKTGSSGEATAQTGATKKDSATSGETDTSTTTAAGTGTSTSHTGETGTTTAKPLRTAKRDPAGIVSKPTGIVQQIVGEHQSDVVAVAISGNLSFVASAEANGLVLTHSLADESNVIDRFEVEGKILGLSFNSSSDHYAVLTPKTIFIRDFVNRRTDWQETPRTEPEFTCLTHRPFSEFYLVGRLDRSAVLRGPGEKGNPGSRERLVGHDGPITSVAMSASGRLAVTASEDRTLRVWHMDSKQQVGEYPVEAVITQVAISPDERRIIGVSSLGLHSWDLFTWQPFPIVPLDHAGESGVALIGDKPFAVTAGSNNSLNLLNLETLQKSSALTTEGKPPARLIAVSPDGIAAVTAGTFPDSTDAPDRTVTVWRLPDVNPVSFEPDGEAYDVLSHLNLKRDIVNGSWTLEEGNLVSGTESSNAIHLPASVPLEYTLHMRVRRSNGMGLLRIWLPFHNTIGSLVINANSGKISGLEFIDGKDVRDNGQGYSRQWIVGWKREHIIRATVTADGITASVDGVTLFDWKGSPDQLTRDPLRSPDWPVVREIGLVTGSAQYTFSSIQLLPPGAEASTISTPPIIGMAYPPVEQIATPAASDLQAERERLRSSIADAYADTKNRPTLIAQLIKLANDSDDAPATQFVAWSEAASLAGESGDATQAFLTLDRLTARFSGLHYELKEKVFTDLSRKRDAATTVQLVLFGFGWVEELIDATRFNEATSILSRARGAAVRLKDARLRELADYFSTRIRTLSRSFAPVKDLAERLNRNPDDTEAAQAVGMFHCFVAEDWDRGLPLLENADDATLKQLVSQDLASPETPDEQVALADAWWAYSSTRPAGNRDAVRRRAGYWYVSAIVNLPQVRQAEVRTKEQRVPSESANITIAGKFDDGDTLTIRRDGAVWQSGFSLPTDVYINRFLWKTVEQNTLPNRGATRFLPHGVHFGRVRLQQLEGRSQTQMTVSADEITIRISDRSPGSGTYQLLLSFGS